MEENDDRVNDDGSSAMIIDSASLQNVMSESGLHELPESDHGGQDLVMLTSSSTSTAILHDDDENNDEKSRRIGEVTRKYLAGTLSLADFAAVLDNYNDPRDKSAENDDEQPTTSKPTFELLDQENASKPSSTISTIGEHADSNMDIDDNYDDVPTQVIETDTTTQDDGSIEPSSQLWNSSFYSSGDTVSTFNLKKRKKMSAVVQGLIGTAHLEYARGNNEAAINVCMEIIKEQPTFVEPFNTLSMIYENMGGKENLEKSLQYALIAGYLDPKHFKDWPKLAQMSLDQDNNMQQAVTCYTKAIAVEPSEPSLYFSRSELLQKIGDFKGAIRSYQRLIQAMPKNGKACLKAYKAIAEMYYDENDIEKAYDFLNIGVEEHSEHVTNNELNLFLGLAITVKKYKECIQNLIKFANISFTPPLNLLAFESKEALSKALLQATRVNNSPSYPDLNANLMVVLINLEAFHLSESLMKYLTSTSVENCGDLYLDVAEAYMAKSRADLALPLLQTLVNSENFSQAVVWLRYADCLHTLKKYEEAAVAYQKVVHLAPRHNVARLKLSEILQKLGRSEDALQTLTQDQEEDKIDHHLIVEKCNIFIRQNMPYELIETAQFLFLRHCHSFRSKEDTLGLITTHPSKRFESVQNSRIKREEHPDDKRPVFVDKANDVEAEWKIYLSVCQLVLDMERYDLLERFTYTAWSSELFGQNPDMEKSARLHCYLSALLNVDQELLAPHVKLQSLNPSELNVPMLRNLFAKAIQRYDYVRYGRHLSRLIVRAPEDDDLKLLRAHHNFSCGNYKTALNQYFYLHSVTPENPLVPLMIASCLLSLLSQKTSTNRSYVAIQVVAFMHKYVHVRGDCQESFYNMGRALHLLGMYQDAISYYTRALEMDPVESPLSEQKKVFFGDEKILDLRKDILYNLARLYESTGSPHMARSYIKQIRV